MPPEGGTASRSGANGDLRAAARRVLARLNEQADRHFRSTDSNLRPIAARLREGHTEDECRLVVDAKVRDWFGSDMSRYLRPSTLFRPSKFSGYLENARRHTTSQKQPPVAVSDGFRGQF